MKSVRNPIDVAFGAGLRAQRQAARLSLEELGRRIGVTYQQVQKYESGANRVSISTLARMAAALDCRIDDLTGAIPQGDTVRDAPTAQDLRLAMTIGRLSDENREKFAGLIEAVAETEDRARPARHDPRSAAPAH